MAALIAGLFGRIVLGAYAAASVAATPFVHVLLRRRAAAGKEDPARLAERWGYGAALRPPGRLVWFHAASVGESLSLLPVLSALRESEPDLALLVTTATTTSAELLAKRLPPGVQHQFAPVDTPSAVQRFLRHWRPAIALFIESELWPNMLATLRARAVPVVLVNGRMSERSFRRWQLFPNAARSLLGVFSVVLAQSATDADRFRGLGAKDVRDEGNLKFAGADLPVDAAALSSIRAGIAGRLVWVAASTHEGEERAAARAHGELSRRVPNLLTIVVPRHPQRGAAIADVLRAEGFPVSLRSRGESLATAQVYVADTLGELGLWYRLASVAFVGGSLVPHGGHNPIEPARLGCAVVTGPHMENFADVARQLGQGGELTVLESDAGLAGAVAARLAPAEEPRAFAAAREGARALDAVLATIRGLLQKAER